MTSLLRGEGRNAGAHSSPSPYSINIPYAMTDIYQFLVFFESIKQIYLVNSTFSINFAVTISINIHCMKSKNKRLATIKMIISSTEIGNQEELLQHLKRENIVVTQATLSRDLKQLKVAKAASMNGKYVYVLPNETMYRRVQKPLTAAEMLASPGFLSINFSGNLGVIKTRPGYASSIAYNIDNADVPEILGTIAGDDTIIIVIKQGVDHNAIIEGINNITEI